MKPVELIVTNELYEFINKVTSAAAKLPGDLGGKLLTEAFTPNGNDAIARSCLCQIAHQASLRDVLRALAALGGPSSLDEISQRVTAIRDQQASHVGA